MSLEPTEALRRGQFMLFARCGSKGKTKETAYHIPVSVLAMLAVRASHILAVQMSQPALARGRT